MRSWIFRHRSRLRRILGIDASSPPPRVFPTPARRVERRGAQVWLLAERARVETRRRAG